MEKIGFWARLFGCRHKRMSSHPITTGGESYRICIKCGARRKFDLKTFQMHGEFYFETNNPGKPL